MERKDNTKTLPQRVVNFAYQLKINTISFHLNIFIHGILSG